MLFYRAFSYLTPILLQIGALFSSKIRKTLKVRKDWKEQAKSVAGQLVSPVIFHCASLGEYDQALPLIEGMRSRYPDKDLLISFFSPSGYEIVKKKSPQDPILYLPLDTPGNMKKWLDILRPSSVFFARYEYWPNLLFDLEKRGIPYFFFSCVFRRNTSVLKNGLGFIRDLVFSSKAIFVQDDLSKEVLEKYDYKNVIVAGDTRIDRVLKNNRGGSDDEYLNKWAEDQKVLILGSVHREDLFIVNTCLNWAKNENWKVLIASHEVEEDHIEWWLSQIGNEHTGRWSRGEIDQPFLLLDTVGLLAKAYSLGDAAYIGGGFSKSIHNTLEPAAAGIPIAFGPRHHKFVEASMLIEKGAAFPVEEKFDIEIWLSQILNENDRRDRGQKAMDFITGQQGAAEKIFAYIEDQNIIQ